MNNENRRMTGRFDKNGIEIGEGDTIVRTTIGIATKYIVKYGIGTYDSGMYEYIGFYAEDESGDSDGTGQFLLDPDIEIINKV